MSSTPNAGTSIRPLTGVLQDDPDKVDAIRDSLRCTGVLPSFAVLDGTKKDGTKKLQARSTDVTMSLKGRLMEALYNWGFFLTNGFFPYVNPRESEDMTKARLSRMCRFEAALKEVMLTYLSEKDMDKLPLRQVKPEIIPVTIAPGVSIYKLGLEATAHFLPILYKDGRVPAFPPDCEIMAMAMNRMLIVRTSTERIIDESLVTPRKAGAAKGLSASDLFFPNQSYSNNPRSAMNPRAHIFKHADAQHQGSITDEELAASQLSNVSPAFQSVGCTTYLHFEIDGHRDLYLMTGLKADQFPFPHNLEPNYDRHPFVGDTRPEYRVTALTCNHKECTVAVTYKDGHENTYNVPVELYCGDMIDYVNRHVKNGSSIRNIGEVKQGHLPAPPKQPLVPYITCEVDQGTNTDGTFRVMTTSSYQHLAQTGAGNASASIADMVF